MWYTVESDLITIRAEGEDDCRATYQTLRQAFRLPPFEVMALALSGDFDGVLSWNDSMYGRMVSFRLGKDRRIRLDLVPKNECIAVGNVCYGSTNTLIVTFNGSFYAKEILGLFHKNSPIFYGDPQATYVAMSVRELIDRLDGDA